MSPPVLMSEPENNCNCELSLVHSMAEPTGSGRLYRMEGDDKEAMYTESPRIYQKLDFMAL